MNRITERTSEPAFADRQAWQQQLHCNSYACNIIPDFKKLQSNFTA